MIRSVTGMMVLTGAVLFLVCAVIVAQEEEPEPVLAVYEVRDLLFPVPDYEVPDMKISHKQLKEQRMRDPFPGVGDPPTPAQALIDLIKDCVEPGTWEVGSGNAIRHDRSGLVVVHEPDVQKQVQALLEELRKRIKTDMVSVHISLVTPSQDAIRRMSEQGVLLAVTAEEKAKLLNLTGPPVRELKLLAMDGQKVDYRAGRETHHVSIFQSHREADIIPSGTAGWIHPAVLDPGVVTLNFEVSVTEVGPKSKEPSSASTSILRVRGTCRIPDGALLLTGGGPPAEGGSKSVYALIRVQIIRVPRKT